MIELGGSITLDGFSDRDYAELIVVKKIVGRYARQLSDAYSGFQSLGVRLEAGEPHIVNVTCNLETRKAEAKKSDRNLFVALDSALKDITKRL